MNTGELPYDGAEGLDTHRRAVIGRAGRGHLHWATMSGSAGWYPDPGHQDGMYRYWDGQRWSTTLSASPAADPPPEMQGEPEQPTSGFTPGEPSGNRLGWVLAGAALVAVIVIAVLVVPRFTGPGLVGADPLPNGQGSINPCPPMATAMETGYDHPNDGRLHGGPLSIPRLGSPWSAPYGDTRVPFGRDVIQQTVTIEENYTANSSWVASVLLAELRIGDGFYEPAEAAGIVAKCVTGAFYGDAVVERDDQVNEETEVDGHEAWILESQLSFDIDNLQTKGELMIIVIVKVDDWRSGLFYASIPDTAPELVPTARDALEHLEVSS